MRTQPKYKNTVSIPHCTVVYQSGHVIVASENKMTVVDAENGSIQRTMELPGRFLYMAELQPSMWTSNTRLIFSIHASRYYCGCFQDCHRRPNFILGYHNGRSFNGLGFYPKIFSQPQEFYPIFFCPDHFFSELKFHQHQTFPFLPTTFYNSVQ